MPTPPDRPILPPLSRRESNAEDNVLPLINVVFLLLIFFMVSGTLMQEPPFPLTPPATEHVDTQDADPDYLAVGADGRLAWRGELIDEAGLTRRLAERGETAAPLQVRADRRLEARELTRLLGVLRESEVTRIQLLTETQ